MHLAGAFREDGCVVTLLDSPDGKKPSLILGPCRQNQKSGVLPQVLCALEVNAVLVRIPVGLLGVVLELPTLDGPSLA